MPIKALKGIAETLDPQRQIRDLEARLAAAEETLRAIRCGEIDALLEADGSTGRVLPLGGYQSGHRILVEAMKEGAAIVGDRAIVLYCNNSLASMLGRPLESVMGSSLTLFFPASESAELDELLEKASQAACSRGMAIVQPDGTRTPVLLSLSPMRIHDRAEVCLVVTDLTEQKAHEAEIETSLREKEVLLREIYHRVKNNLQVIQSLLKMRARLLPKGETRAAIEATVQRIHAMALIHRLLYQMEDLARLPLEDYLRHLFGGVVASSSMQPERIHLDLDIEEIPLGLDMAIPFGLLANELLANCLKHGFPGNRRGRVQVYVGREQGAVHMVIKDNGVGLPDGFDARQSCSMGLKLAASLAHQLGGSCNSARKTDAGWIRC